MWATRNRTLESECPNPWLGASKLLRVATHCGVIDYGLGNFLSVQNMLQRAGQSSRSVTAPDETKGLTHLIIPGVGSFDHAMRLLDERGWVDFLPNFVGSPSNRLLGICLGAQLLGTKSEEGKAAGLGLLEVESLRFAEKTGFPVPHMRWNSAVSTPHAPAWLNLEPDFRFYFAHSYFLSAPSRLTYATTNHGSNFSSIIGERNVYGFQFHPEKSHRFGRFLLEKFLVEA